MKIIDILNKKANGTLEDGFKFIYRNYMYAYNKEDDNIENTCNSGLLGDVYKLEKILNDEAEVIEEDKEIEEIPNELISEDLTKYIIDNHNKINELVRAVNKINNQLTIK